MASINVQCKDGGGDGSRSPARYPRVSSSWNKIVTGDIGELALPVVSVAAPVSSPSSLYIHDQIVNASSDWYPPETARSPDDSGKEYQSEGSEYGGSNAVKKAVWRKPSSGVVDVVSPVMGAVSWPALGESTKAAPKSSSSESLQALSDGLLLPPLQVTGNLSSSSHKTASLNNTNPTSTPNHVAPSGQRSMKRGGGSPGAYASSNGGPRGGYYHHNYGGKLDQGRGNQEWNQCRNFNNNMQSQRGFHRGGYIRPTVHNSTPFIPPMHVPVRPFGNNVIYPDVSSTMIYFQGPPPPIVPGPLYYSVSVPVLHVDIVNQIDYYFSNENLVRDTYLRRNMDGQGWVSVNLIAGFQKVSRLTDNVQLILDVMRTSTVVEVQGDKMRRRNDWMRWLMPSVAQDSLAAQGGGERAAVA